MLKPTIHFIKNSRDKKSYQTYHGVKNNKKKNEKQRNLLQDFNLYIIIVY